METTINERIAQLTDSLRKSTNAFAKSIGRPATTITHIVSGRSKPGFELLEAICDTYPSVNPVWLLRGEGQMFLDAADEAVIKPSAPDQYLQEQIKKLEESFNRLTHQFESQLEVKDTQIQSLSEMLKMTLGKYKDVAQFETARTRPMYQAYLPAKQG